MTQVGTKSVRGVSRLSRLAAGAWLAVLAGCALWLPIAASDLTTRARISQLFGTEVLGRLAALELLSASWLVLGLAVAASIPLSTLSRSAGAEIGQRAVWFSVVAGSTALAWLAPRALARGLLDTAPGPLPFLGVTGLIFAGASLCGWIALRLGARTTRLLGQAGLVAWLAHWVVWPWITGAQLAAVTVGAATVGLAGHPWAARSRTALAVLGIGALSSLLLCLLGQPPVELDGAAAAGSPTDSPHVVVFVVDTQRWDRTSLAGGLATTPHLAALAEAPGTTTFSAASAAASATIPSIKSLFTARASSSWGLDSAGREPPPETAWTMARAFKKKGYATATLSTNGLVRGGGFDTGFERQWVASGFDLYQHSFVLNNLLSGGDHWHGMRTLARRRLHKVSGRELLGRFGEWLRSDDPRPRFFYLHILEPHWPFHDHGRGFVTSGVESTREMSHVDLHLLGKDGTGVLPTDTAEFRNLEERYAEEIYAADLILGELLAQLEAAGVDRDTLLVVTGDHGEEFLEHGRFSHGYDVFEEQTHVPLVIRWPQRQEYAGMPSRIDTPVSLLDVFPTLSEILDLDRPPRPFDGRTLVDLLRGGAALQPVVAESFEGSTCRASVRRGNLKVRLMFSATVSPLDTSDVQVFDLAADPREESPLEPWSEEAEALAAEARAILDARWRSWPDRLDAEAGTPDDPLEGLRDLGYVQ